MRCRRRRFDGARPCQGDPRLADVAEPGLGVALEAALEQPAEARRGRGGKRSPGDRLLDHRGQDVRDRLAVEEPAAGQHLEQHDAEGPDVGALVDGLAPRLLGGHVGGGAEDQAGRGAGAGQGRRLRQGGRAAGERVVVSAPGLGEAEVEDLDLALRGQLDVRGLEVAVHDALLVGLLEGLGDLHRDGDRFVDGDRPPLQPLREVLAFHQLHGDEVDRSPTIEARALEAVEVRDVRMVQGGEEPGLRARTGRVARNPTRKPRAGA